MTHRTIICVMLAVVGVALACGEDTLAEEQAAQASSSAEQADDQTPQVGEPTPIPPPTPQVGMPASGPKPDGQVTVLHEPEALSNDYTDYGVTTLEERILRADLIVRARLRSKEASSRWYYRPTSARNVYLS